MYGGGESVGGVASLWDGHGEGLAESVVGVVERHLAEIVLYLDIADCRSADYIRRGIFPVGWPGGTAGLRALENRRGIVSVQRNGSPRADIRGGELQLRTAGVHRHAGAAEPSSYLVGYPLLTIASAVRSVRELELIVRSVDVYGHGIVHAVYLNAVAAEKRGELAVPDISREFQLVLTRNGCSACGCVGLLVFLDV